MQDILFVSNLFPTPGEPQRGLFNAAFVEALQRYVEPKGGRVRVIVPVSSRLRCEKVVDWEYPLSSLLGSNVRYVSYCHIPYIGRNLAARFCEQSLRSQADWFRQADVVVGSWLYPDAVAAACVARETGTPFVARLHGTDRFHLLARGRGRACRACLQDTQHIIVNAQFMADFLSSEGFPDATVVPNGVNRDRFYLGTVQERDDGLVLWAGNLVSIKDPGRAIRVFHAAMEAGAKRLVVAGQGPLLAALQKQVSRTGLQDEVSFVGSVPPDTLATYMRKASCLLLTSKSEGMPNVVYEALRCGTPVVATRVGDVERFIRNGKNGYCCDVRSDPELIRGVKDVLLGSWRPAQVCEVSPIPAWQDSAAAFMRVLEGGDK